MVPWKQSCQDGGIAGRTVAEDRADRGFLNQHIIEEGTLFQYLPTQCIDEDE